MAFRHYTDRCSRVPSTLHSWGQVAGYYDWRRVAERTVRVYDDVFASRRDDSTAARLGRAAKCGPWFGKLCCCILAVDLLLLRWLRWWRPAADIDAAPDYVVQPRAGTEPLQKKQD